MYDLYIYTSINISIYKDISGLCLVIPHGAAVVRTLGVPPPVILPHKLQAQRRL